MTLAILGAGGHAKSVYYIVKNKKKIFKVIIAIGNNQDRKKFFELLKKNTIDLDTLIHSKSYLGFRTQIGEGTVILQGSLINTDSKIGNNCIVNSHVSIDHDCIIKDHTHICPGVNIGGNVKIRKNCWIGLGAKIIQNCVIGDNVFVAAGAVVTKNLKSNSFVKGIPAEYAKKKLA